MERTDRPVGRQRRFGSGGGAARRRGEGLGGATGGPVGNAGGYSDRAGGTGYRGTGGAGRGVGPLPGGCLKPTGIGAIIIIIALAFFLNSMFKEEPVEAPASNSSIQSGYQPSAASGSQAHTDTGAYKPDASVSSLARAKRTVLKGGGRDTATVMVYMCATDLESENGMATSDLQEMLYAELSDKVNVIVETGGTTKWRNEVISSRTNQRYELTTDGMKLLEKDLGRKSMVKPETLTDFIKYCKAEYPADRYILVLWDHGGGSLTGYGYDQNFPGNSMTLDEIASALKNGKCTFDIIGFDACLMATYETAMVLEPYCDYMIASEEVEPGFGWDYTGWLTMLSENTSTSSVDLGKRLIDDYIKDSRSKSPQSQATLSLIDLAEMKSGVPGLFASFAQSTTKLIDKEEYKKVSDARAGAKEFARSSKINQVDLVHLAQNLGTSEAKELVNALKACIKYNRTTPNITNSNGLSIFFPYGKLTKLGAMLDTYEKIDIGDEYSECIRSFASIAAGGQVVSGSSGNALSALLTGSAGGQQEEGPSGQGSGLENTLGYLLEQFFASKDFSAITGEKGSELGWLDADRMRSSIAYYESNSLAPEDLKLQRKGGQRVLELAEEKWALVQSLEMNVFLDDGEGFIDLGLDNVFEFTEDGDLVMEYDGTWLALNGNVVSYYMMSEDRYQDGYTIKGRVPALLNGRLVDIILVFDDENPDGIVAGAQVIYDEGEETGTVAKGLVEIVAGDSLDFLCDYYAYDGEYSDTYYLGEQYTATGEWAIENVPVGADDYRMTYRITDIYGNRYWTPAVTN